MLKVYTRLIAIALLMAFVSFFIAQCTFSPRVFIQGEVLAKRVFEREQFDEDGFPQNCYSYGIIIQDSCGTLHALKSDDATFEEIHLGCMVSVIGNKIPIFYDTLYDYEEVQCTEGVCYNYDL